MKIKLVLRFEKAIRLDYICFIDPKALPLLPEINKKIFETLSGFIRCRACILSAEGFLLSGYSKRAPTMKITFPYEMGFRSVSPRPTTPGRTLTTSPCHLNDRLGFLNFCPLSAKNYTIRSSSEKWCDREVAPLRGGVTYFCQPSYLPLPILEML